MTPLQQINKLLPKLSKAELKTLRLNPYLKGAAVDQATTAPMSDDWLFAGIQHELRKRGLLSGSIPKALVDRDAPSYREDSSVVRERLRNFLARELKQTPNAAKTRVAVDPLLPALGRTAAAALASMLEGGPAPMGPRLLLRNASRVVEALEYSYPGYIRCGMLSMVVRMVPPR